MTSAYSSLPSYFRDRILCYYINPTAQIQRACITNIPNWLFERVIFPQQRLFFEAIPEAQLEIHTCPTSGKPLLERIPCLGLQVNVKSCLSNEIILSSDLAHQID
jgi:Domain of unknown function (DUF1830)